MIRLYYKVSIDNSDQFRIKIKSVKGNEYSSYVYQMLCDGQSVVVIDKIEEQFANMFVNFSIKDFGKWSTQVDSYDLNSILFCDLEGVYLSDKYNISQVFSITYDPAKYGKQHMTLTFIVHFF